MHSHITAAALLIAACCASAPTLRAQTACADHTLVVETAATFRSVGRALDVDGSRLAVASTDGGSSQPGNVHFFERAPSGAWEYDTFIDQPAGIVGSDEFGAHIALNGDRIAIAAPRDDSQGLDTGVVFVFERSSTGVWEQKARLEGPPLVSQSGTWPEFGTRLVLEGDVLAVGAPRVGEPLLDGQGVQIGSLLHGAVFVYRRDANGAWLLEAELEPPVKIQNARFGQGVALAGGRLSIGTSLDKVGLVSTSTVRTYESNGAGGWTQTWTIFEPTFSTATGFARDVFAHGDSLVVSSQTNGLVHAYERTSSGGWSAPQTLSAAPAAPQQPLVAIVDLEDDLLCVSAGATGLVSYYVFTRENGGPWYQLIGLRPCETTTSAWNGSRAAVSATQFFVGAPNASVVGSQSGVVRVFERAALYHTHLSNSVAAPVGQQLSLRAGPHWSGAPYLVLGSVSGSGPGIDLGGVSVPLVYDAYTEMTLARSAPIEDDFELLKANGDRNAFFATPTGLGAFVGLELRHAFVAVHPQTFELFVSNAVTLELVP